MVPKGSTLGLQHYSFWRERLSDGTVYVYVIRAGKKSPVKIGKAIKPTQRLKALQTGNAQTLRLLLVVPGGERLEYVLHRRFARFRLESSEWFHGEGVREIMEFVTALSVDLVRAYEPGSLSMPTLTGFPGWTAEERRLLDPRMVTIPMAPPRPPEEVEPMRQSGSYNFVPTIRSRVCRTRLRAPNRPSNSPGPCTQ